MRRFRLVIAALVATAMIMVGAAACTPADQIKAGQTVEALYHLLESAIGLGLLYAVCQPNCTGF